MKILTPPDYPVSEKDIVEDLKRVAKVLNKKTLRVKDYKQSKIRKYNISLINRRFAPWNDLLEKAGLEISKWPQISDEEIIDDLKRVAKMLNQDTLTVTNYARSKINKYNHTTIRIRFGGWNNALEKAGLELNKTIKLSEEELIEDLKRVAKMLNKKTVKVSDYAQSKIRKYNFTIIERAFGSWNIALKKAGLELSRNREISEEELIEDLKRVAKALNKKTLRVKDYTQSKIGKYNSALIYKRLGGWKNASEKAGLKLPKRTKSSENELLEGLGNTDKIPFKNTLKGKGFKQGKIRKNNRNTIKARLEGLNDATEKAGREKTKRYKPSEEELIEDLKKVAKELNKKTLTSEEYAESNLGKFRTGTILYKFGRWNDALEKAGLEIIIAKKRNI